MIRRTAVLLLCLAAWPLARANDSVSTALPILQSRYLDFADLQAQPTDKLTDLVAKSRGEIYLSAVPATVAASQPVLLPNGLIYWRLAAFPSPAAPIFSQLKSQVAAGGQGLILDLRSNATPDDYEGAARMAGLFIRAEVPLFFINKEKMSDHPVLSYTSSGAGLGLEAGPIAVLMNGETSGAGEALATVLKANGALTVGRSTAGDCAEFESFTLAPDQVMHYLAGRVTTSDGTDLWRRAVQPDIGILTDPKKERMVLGLIAQGKLLDVIHESAGSHRLSEATLVRGEDPSVEAYLTPKVKTVPVPQDAALMEALDSLKAIRLSQGVTSGSSPAAVQ